MMRPSLQITLSQQLKITPQLKQAIRLLQLSQTELETELHEQLESNPLLELDQGEPSVDSEMGQQDSRSDSEEQLPDDQDIISESREEEDSWLSRATDPTMSSGNTYSAPDDPYYNVAETAADGLVGHLRWQLQMQHLSDTDQAIAEVILDELDADGFLKADILSLAEQFDDPEIGVEEIHAVRHMIQHCEPAGCASLTLEECLTAQLNEFPPSEYTQLARRLMALKNGLSRLALQKDQEIQQALGCSAEAFAQACTLIRQLDPKPGRQYPSVPTEYVSPDVYVKQMNGQWQVSLNDQTIPALKIDRYYEGLLAQSKGQDAQYLRAHLQEAKWLIRSLAARQDTVLRVATCIVAAQAAFFEYGPQAMRPLVLKDIADQLDLHESTISRVTRGKYLHCPRGVFEFKYFFSSGVSTADGGSASATAIQAHIQQLIEDEKPDKPLSDSALEKTLKDAGFNVARRTVAKYREALGIPSSSKRRQRV